MRVEFAEGSKDLGDGNSVESVRWEMCETLHGDTVTQGSAVPSGGMQVRDLPNCSLSSDVCCHDML